ncbi:MAG: zinc-binding dehydrogenase [Halobacteria archaeon]
MLRALARPAQNLLSRGPGAEVARAAVRRLRRATGEEMPGFIFSSGLWARARLRGLSRRRRLVRGTAVLWRRPGKVWPLACDLPKPGPGEVLVRTHASAVSPGTERALYARMPNTSASFPLIPGYSAAGEVAAAGRGVRGLRRGDRVAGAAPHTSIALLPEKGAHPVPDGVELEAASFVQLGVIAAQALRQGGTEPDCRVLVVGQGLVGQLIAQMAAAAGARVTSSARSLRRSNLALERAARVVPLGQAAGRGEFDVVFETTGHPDGPSIALESARPGGRVVLAGSTRGITRGFDFGAAADREVEVVGAHVNGAPDPGAHARLFLDLLRRKKIDVAPLIRERLHPWEAGWFYRRLTEPGDATVGALFRWDLLPERERMRPVSYLEPPDLSFVPRNYLPPLPGVRS